NTLSVIRMKNGVAQPVTSFQMGCGAIFTDTATLVIADADGDGYPDVLDAACVRHYGHAPVYVYLNNRDGTFGPAVRVNLPATNTPHSFLLRDLNARGVPDLVTVEDDGTVSVFDGPL